MRISSETITLFYGDGLLEKRTSLERWIAKIMPLCGMRSSCMLLRYFRSRAVRCILDMREGHVCSAATSFVVQIADNVLFWTNTVDAAGFMH